MSGQRPYEACDALLRLVLSGSLLEETNASKIMHVILNSDSFQTKKQQEYYTDNEIECLRNMLQSAKALHSKQLRGLSATKIQSAIRGYLARKRLAKQLTQDHRDKLETVKDTFTREVTYNQILTNLAQHFCVPLLNTSDNKLKEESKDLRDILQSIVGLELLHRLTPFLYINFTIILSI